jgi:hypothetical protein
MDIKAAKEEAKSSTLKAAGRSDLTIYGLFAGLAIAGIAWVNAPKEIQDKITAAGAAALVPIGFVLKNFNTSIKNGRLSVGDLEGAVSNYALFSGAEAKIVDSLKPVIEGRLNLADLPEVRSEIERQVKTRTAQPFNQEKFEEKILGKLDQFKPVIFPSDNGDGGTALPHVDMVSHYPPNPPSPSPKPGLDGLVRTHSLSDLATIAEERT